MRLTIALLLALLCSSAHADSAWKPAADTFRKMFPGKPPPVVDEPLPPMGTPQDDALAAIERALAEAEAKARRAEEAALRAEEALREVTPDPKSPVVMLPPPRPKVRARQPQPLNIRPDDPDYISCSDARRGVSMSCFTLRLNSHVYESYSKKKKAMATACLTVAERARIAGCFQ